MMASAAVAPPLGTGGTFESALVVRRSIHIAAPPERVWQELETRERFARWWGVNTDVLKTEVVRWEPRVGGWFENRGTHSGTPINFKGQVVAVDPPREITFEWMGAPERGWTAPTLITIRLTPHDDGTVVEILHHGWERLSDAGRALHRAFESGWTMAELRALREVVES
jgi:uncharacterized protein YndB with AHSA1/START domain